MRQFDAIINSPFLLRHLEKGTKVIRMRLHDKPDQVFKYKEELTYPPSNVCSLMRANLEYQPIFYGSIFSDRKDEKDTPRFTCLCETCKEVRDVTFVGKKDFTYSLWVSKRPIKLFIVPIFDNYLKPPIDFQWYFKFWEKLISEFKISEEIISDLKILSEKFSYVPVSKEEEFECYSCTASFTNQLLSTYSEIDGIIYPSARLGNEGLGINVAIRPEVIDEDFEIRYASICHLFKRNRSLQTILTYKRGRVSQNGKISYAIDPKYFHAKDRLNTENSDYNIEELEFIY